MVSDERELGLLIGKSIKESQDLNRTMSHPSGEDTFIIFPTHEVELVERAVRLKTRTIGTAFILGHPANAILGTSQLGSSTLSGWSTVLVLPPNNLFREWFGSTEYQDTVTSTCTVVTADGEASFTNGEIYQSSIIYDNNTTLVSVRPIIKVRSGSATANIDTTESSTTINVWCDD